MLANAFDEAEENYDKLLPSNISILIKDGTVDRLNIIEMMQHIIDDTEKRRGWREIDQNTMEKRLGEALDDLINILLIVDGLRGFGYSTTRERDAFILKNAKIELEAMKKKQLAIKAAVNTEFNYFADTVLPHTLFMVSKDLQEELTQREDERFDFLNKKVVQLGTQLLTYEESLERVKVTKYLHAFDSEKMEKIELKDFVDQVPQFQYGMTNFAITTCRNEVVVLTGGRTFEHYKDAKKNIRDGEFDNEEHYAESQKAWLHDPVSEEWQ